MHTLTHTLYQGYYHGHKYGIDADCIKYIFQKTPIYALFHLALTGHLTDPLLHLVYYIHPFISVHVSGFSCIITVIDIRIFMIGLLLHQEHSKI